MCLRAHSCPDKSRNDLQYHLVPVLVCCMILHALFVVVGLPPTVYQVHGEDQHLTNSLCG